MFGFGPISSRVLSALRWWLDPSPHPSTSIYLRKKILEEVVTPETPELAYSLTKVQQITLLQPVAIEVVAYHATEAVYVLREGVDQVSP